MKIEVPMAHAAQPDAVHAMMLDPRYHERKCVAGGAQSHAVEVVPDGDRTVVTVLRTMPADDLPDLLKTFARHGVDVRETIDWAPMADDGSWVARLTIEFVGQPLAMRGTLGLRPSGGGTVGGVSADLKAAVPLLGSKIEKAAAPLILDAIATEERVAHEWLGEGG